METSGTEEKVDKSTLQRRSGSVEGIFYSGFATSFMDEMGEVVLVGKDLNELIQRWYSMTDAKLDISKVMPVAMFKEGAVKVKDSDSVKTSAIE